MGKAIDTISFSATAPGAGGAALYTALAGDSLQVRNGAPGSRVNIIQHWALQNVVGFQQSTWPSGHDTTRNYRARVPALVPTPLMPMGYGNPIQPQENMIITGAGSAVAGNIEIGSFLMYYDDLPGTDANLIDSAELVSRMIRIMTVDMVITPTTNGAYSGPIAINAQSDLLHAITDYAWLGATFSQQNHLVGLRSPDWGNLRISIPAPLSVQDDVRQFFPNLSDWLGKPCIPVLNSGNKGGILCDTVTNQGGTTTSVSLILAELKPR